MRVALIKNPEHFVIASEIEKEEGPFVCCQCRQGVTLKKGLLKEHHFAHLPSSTCPLAAPESDLHLYVKAQICLALMANPKCQMAQIEYHIDLSIADVYAMIDGHPVAVEIQNSESTINEIADRTAYYKASGIYCLWVLPHTIPQGNVALPAWIRLIHAMYLDRVYYWFDRSNVYPIHFDRYKNIGGQLLRTEAYYNQARPALRGPLVDIANFSPLDRKAEGLITHLHIGMKDSLLWHDGLPDWWD